MVRVSVGESQSIPPGDMFMFGLAKSEMLRQVMNDALRSVMAQKDDCKGIWCPHSDYNHLPPYYPKCCHPSKNVYTQLPECKASHNFKRDNVHQQRRHREVKRANKATSTDDVQTVKITHDGKRNMNEGEFETYITVSSEPTADGVRKLMYVTSTPCKVTEYSVPTNKLRGTPSIRLYVKSSIENRIDNQSSGYPSPKSTISRGKLTVQTTSINNISIEQSSNSKLYPPGSLTNSDYDTTFTSVSSNNWSSFNNIYAKKTENSKLNSVPLIIYDEAKNSIDSRHSNRSITVIEKLLPASVSTELKKEIPNAPPLPMSTIIDSLPGKQGNTNESSTLLESELSFPWEKLEEEKIKGTVWEKCKLSLTDISLDDLMDSSNKSPDGSFRYTKNAAKGDSKRETIFLLSHKKAYNIAIILGCMKRTIPEVMNAIYELNDEIITQEVLSHLIQYAPDEHEIMRLRNVESYDNLEDPDKLAYELIQLPEFMKRLNSMLLRVTFNEKAEDIRKSINTVSKACNVLATSTTIKNLIELVLILGNWLNKDSIKYGKAQGFKIDVLSKLENTRIKNKHSSVMNLLLRLSKIKLKNIPNMHNEIKLLSLAASVEVASIEEDIKKLNEALKESEETTEAIYNISKSMNTPDKYVTKMSEFQSEATEAIMKLKQEFCIMKDLYNDVKKYFGEDSKEAGDERFFATFSEFLSKFQKLFINECR